MRENEKKVNKKRSFTLPLLELMVSQLLVLYFRFPFYICSITYNVVTSCLFVTFRYMSLFIENDGKYLLSIKSSWGWGRKHFVSNSKTFLSDFCSSRNNWKLRGHLKHKKIWDLKLDASLFIESYSHTQHKSSFTLEPLSYNATRFMLIHCFWKFCIL